MLCRIHIYNYITAILKHLIKYSRYTAGLYATNNEGDYYRLLKFLSNANVHYS